MAVAVAVVAMVLVLVLVGEGIAEKSKAVGEYAAGTGVPAGFHDVAV